MVSEIPRIQKETDPNLESVGKFVCGLIFIVALLSMSAITAWVLTILWRWYVMPVFDARQIGVAQAYGLLLIFGLIRKSKSAREAKADSQWMTENSGKWMKHLFGGLVIAPMLALLIGWAVKSWFL